MSRPSLCLTGVLLVTLGCSRAEPELIRAPTIQSLEKYVGAYVSIEGTPYSEKEGELIDANGVSILVGVPLGVPYDWPSSSKTIRVTGTLVKNNYAYDFGVNPYVLESATWVDAANASP